MIDLTEYRLFLKKYRKTNGEYLLPKTIDAYCYYISKYAPKLDTYHNLEGYLDYMNRSTQDKKNLILRSAFETFLKFKGFEVEKGGIINFDGKEYRLKGVKTKQISAFTSKRFLQSKVLTEDEIQRLIDKADTLMMKTIICFLFDLGVRRNELINMRFRDIKFLDLSLPEFEEERKAGIYAYCTIFGKGQKVRTNYLHKTSVMYLQKLYPGEVNLDDKIFVFYEKNGTPYTAQHQKLYEEFRKLGLSALGKELHPHMARHSQISQLSSWGYSDSEIMNLAGHADASTSHRYIENSDRLGKNAMLRNGRDPLEKTRFLNNEDDEN